MKKVLVILLCVVALLTVAGYMVMQQAKKTIASIETEHAALAPVNLAAIPDGVYQGSCGFVPVAVTLAVTVKDHAISGIEIKKQMSGKGYDARAIVPAIIRAQQPKADAVAGATMSSKCIMVAVSRALQKAGR